MRVNEIQILEGPNDPNIFKAVFMAGAPGSGKSTIANKLFSHTGLKSLNVDNFWNLYHKTNKIGDYEKYWELYKKQERTYLDGRLGLLIDGTARNPEKMSIIKKTLESLGYECAMVFVNTSLEVSQDRVLKRAEEIGRSVDAEFVSATWNQVQQGLGKLQNMFGSNFFIVDNNKSQLPRLEYVSKSMEKFLNSPPKMPAAKEWLENQKATRAK